VTLLTGLSAAEGIALDVPNNRMYFVERTGDRITRANLDGTNVVAISDHTPLGATTTERGLALTSTGRLFFADAGTDQIYTVNTVDFMGTPLVPTSVVNLTTLGGGTPNGVATDDTYIYWAEGLAPNRGIYRALLDGTDAMNLIPQAGGSPIGVAVAPVPEPTWVLTACLAAGGAAHGWRRCRVRSN
jgi:sugar lactone lactonase YvrE